MLEQEQGVGQNPITVLENRLPQLLLLFPSVNIASRKKKIRTSNIYRPPRVGAAAIPFFIALVGGMSLLTNNEVGQAMLDKFLARNLTTIALITLAR